MIKIFKGVNNTYVIENGHCHPFNEVGGLNEKDLKILYNKIGKILKKRDFKKEMEEDRDLFIN